MRPLLRGAALAAVAMSTITLSTACEARQTEIETSNEHVQAGTLSDAEVCRQASEISSRYAQNLAGDLHDPGRGADSTRTYAQRLDHLAARADNPELSHDLSTFADELRATSQADSPEDLPSGESVGSGAGFLGECA
ncbi:MAG: hypothetical protein ACRDPK_19580 [Carbonactinosporaceae bacterium]